MRHFSHYIEKAFLKHHQSQKMPRAYLSKGGKKEKLVFIKGEVLCGYHSVMLALQASKRKFFKVYHVENEGYNSKFKDIQEICDIRGIEIEKCNRKVITQLTKYTADIPSVKVPHRGICADVSHLKAESGDDIQYVDSDIDRLWLLLCSIGDPYNLGAIVRSAYFLGVERIFTCSPYDCSQSSSPLSPVASRASAGALEIFTPKVIRHPEEFLERLEQNGWDIIGSTIDPQKREQLSNFQDSSNNQRRKSKILLIGNEGEGVAKSLLDKCNSYTCLQPRLNINTLVDSLNVSVATALLIKQQMK